MSYCSISFGKLGPIVVKKSLKASAISSAEFTSSFSILTSEIFQILPHLHEVSSSISIYVLRGFFLFISKLCIKYCRLACLMALFAHYACVYIVAKLSHRFQELISSLYNSV